MVSFLIILSLMEMHGIRHLRSPGLPQPILDQLLLSMIQRLRHSLQGGRKWLRPTGLIIRLEFLRCKHQKEPITVLKIAGLDKL